MKKMVSTSKQAQQCGNDSSSSGESFRGDKAILQSNDESETENEQDKFSHSKPIDETRNLNAKLPVAVGINRNKLELSGKIERKFVL